CSAWDNSLSTLF
nr:immunoglobulin light chain junction region [Macaca mulatta]MPN68638.1 immunoglobulin light chain junction region [Macaca mulatta]